MSISLLTFWLFAWKRESQGQRIAAKSEGIAMPEKQKPNAATGKLLRALVLAGLYGGLPASFAVFLPP
jgi:hypothetical protein